MMDSFSISEQQSIRIDLNERKLSVIDPFRFRIDPRMYPSIAEMWLSNPRIFTVFEDAINSLNSGSNPIVALSRYGSYHSKLSMVFGNEGDGESAIEKLLSLFKSALNYKHFFKEIGSSLALGLFNPRTAPNKLREDLVRLIYEYSSKISPKAKVWIGEGVFDSKGCNLTGSEVHFIGSQMGKFFGSRLLSEEDMEYEQIDSMKEQTVELTKQVVVYLVTIGPSIDISCELFETKKETYKAYLLNAIGAGAADSVAFDLNLYFNSRLPKTDTCMMFRRMSPGYGDWPLSDQQKLFNLLNPEDDIGVVLNDGDIMIPEKSTSGIMAIKEA